jgi:formylglycine-generating enzyme required for sulfatase activity
MRTAIALFSILMLVPIAPAQQRAFEPRPVRDLPPRDKRWALLIGVDQYDSPSISPLIGAAGDARGMKKVLTEVAGFPPEQVIVLATGETGDFAPTRNNILAAIANVLELVPKDGLLWVQFSGHGIERQKQPFLLPQDARLIDARLQNSLALLQNTSLPLAVLRKDIQDAGIAQVLILLDACRNEPGSVRGDEKNPLSASYVDTLRLERRNQGVQAFATIYATEIGERAWEDPRIRRGYFSAVAEEGLRGAAANEKGEVTLLGLIRHLQAKVPDRVRLSDAGRRQVPLYKMEGYKAEDLVLAFARQPTRPVEVAVNPNAEAVYWRQCETQKGEYCEIYLRRYPQGEYADLALAFLKPALAAGRTKQAPDGLTYVWIPAGEFTMGCSPGDTECYEDEKPPVRVRIREGYWMGQTEVTQRAYERVIGSNPSDFKSPNNPVETVTWQEASAYCSNVGMRLPTEAEWEYAARGGSPAARHGLVNDVAWTDANSGEKTHPVAQKAANGYGLYDMLGNVREWTSSGWSDRPIGGTDPAGGTAEHRNVQRGGSWNYVPRVARASYRGRSDPTNRSYSLGFRCMGK